MASVPARALWQMNRSARGRQSIVVLDEADRPVAPLHILCLGVHAVLLSARSGRGVSQGCNRAMLRKMVRNVAWRKAVRMEWETIGCRAGRYNVGVGFLRRPPCGDD